MPLRGDVVTCARQHYRLTPHGDQFEVDTYPYAEIGVDVPVKTLLTPIQFAEYLVEKFGWCLDRDAGPHDMADDLAPVVADIRSHRISHGGAHAVEVR